MTENQPVVGGWQPWHTAPKDGSTFLAYWDCNILKLVCWDYDAGQFTAFFTDEFDNKSFSDQINNVYAPTHWAPINKPRPAAKAPQDAPSDT